MFQWTAKRFRVVERESVRLRFDPIVGTASGSKGVAIQKQGLASAGRIRGGVLQLGRGTLSNEQSKHAGRAPQRAYQTVAAAGLVCVD